MSSVATPRTSARLSGKADQAKKPVRSPVKKSGKTSQDEGMGLKVLLAVSTVIHLMCMIWTITLPVGSLIPAAAICVHVPAMAVMAFAHSVHHIGAKQSALFMLVIVVIEWSWEQMNVWYDGFIFGNLSYSDTMVGPKLIDIPIIVPLAFAALCWPAFVITNILLHNHPIKLVGPSTVSNWLAHLWRCAIFAFIHTAWSPCVEPVVAKFGAFGYPHVGSAGGGEWLPGTFFSIPFSEFKGWWVMAFVSILSYSIIGPLVSPLPASKPVDLLVDSTPLVLFGGFAAWLIVRPVDPVAGMFALFTMGLCIFQCFYKIVFVATDGKNKKY